MISSTASSIRSKTAVFASVAAFLIGGLTLGDDKKAPPPKLPVPLAHFRFDGNTKNSGQKGEPRFELKNTEFRDNALYLNGVYDAMGEVKEGYKANCRIPKLDSDKFTVAIRYKPEDFVGEKGSRRNNIITAGTNGRWFGMSRHTSGKLTVGFNNGATSNQVENTSIEKGKWVVLACSVDLGKESLLVYQNGKQADELDLPKGLKLFDKDKPDKLWSFTNYASGSTLFGLVDELIIYDRALDASEMAAIPLKP